jgi:hypothetical protein
VQVEEFLCSDSESPKTCDSSAVNVTFPESSLGQCLSSFLSDGKEHVLIAFESFFDGSGSEKNAPFLTLAGMAADDSMWSEFNKGWNDILQSNDPPAVYMHMHEAMPLKEEFDQRKGWTNKKIYNLCYKLLKIMSEMDKTRFRQFLCTIDMDAYRKLESEGLKMDSPVEICSKCPETVLSWYVTKYPGVIQNLHFFFDQGEPFKDVFEKTWIANKANVLGSHGADIFWGLLKTVTTADMRDHPALQAADMLAWSVNRDLTSKYDRPFKAWAHIMHQVIPTTGILWDENRLRNHYARITPPSA